MKIKKQLIVGSSLISFFFCVCFLFRFVLFIIMRLCFSLYVLHKMDIFYVILFLNNLID